MRKLLALSLFLAPAGAFAQAGPPPPAPDDQVTPPTAQPDVQPPPPPVAPPPAPQQSGNDQVGILQQDDGVGILQGGSDSYTEAPAPAPAQAGQWVYTGQYGWVWMPYGSQYVNEGVYGSATPYAFIYSVSFGWRWCAAPWLWGWGPYPYFGAWGPSHFGWYRGLYRSGYGWGHYRGGYPRYSGGGTARGGYGYHATRPTTSAPVNRGGFHGAARARR